jgi:hypothetical protein
LRERRREALPHRLRCREQLDGSRTSDLDVDGILERIGTRPFEERRDALPAQLAAVFDRGLAPRDGPGDPRIVDGTLGAQALDGRVDLVRGVLATRQPLADLRFRQLGGDAGRCRSCAPPRPSAAR